MFFDDHQPTHFHAFYGEYEVIVNIDTLSVIGGKLPPRAFGLVIEWASLHQEELKSDWDKAKQLKPLEPIPPLP